VRALYANDAHLSCVRGQYARSLCASSLNAVHCSVQVIEEWETPALHERTTFVVGSNILLSCFVYPSSGWQNRKAVSRDLSML
jgi:hypothetical protein